ncbi:hypothetical protein FRB99_007654 [Tulasnella sp. 403]|nr:hypothetical protein FRB99_007654 [Tulasnella sp. 403]
MLFFGIFARAIAIVVAYLYPGYETFKTLAYRPGYENQSARWLMYWTVIAVLAAYEYSLEAFIGWFPFYSECKTLFLLFLGSTLIYSRFILPKLLQNEALIDRQIASFHGRIFTYIQNQLQRVVTSVFGGQATALAGAVQQGPRGVEGLGGTGAPVRPGLAPSDPSGTNVQPGADGGPALQAMQDMWRTYGPAVMATGASLLRPAGAPEASPHDPSGGRQEYSNGPVRPTMPASSSSTSSARSSNSAQRPRPQGSSGRRPA